MKKYIIASTVTTDDFSIRHEVELASYIYDNGAVNYSVNYCYYTAKKVLNSASNDYDTYKEAIMCYMSLVIYMLDKECALARDNDNLRLCFD